MRGAAGARWWYRRQVGGFVWRAAWRWGAIAGAILVGRYFLDDFVLPRIFDPLRASAMSQALITTYFLAAAVTSWWTCRIGAGILVAIIASLIGSFASFIYAAVVLIAPVDAWSTRAGLDEVLGVPVILVAVSAAAGTIGGFVGRLLRRGNRHSPAMFGISIGTLIGGMNLLDTAMHPFADDDAALMLVYVGGLLLLWSIAGFGAAGRTRRLADAMKAGAIVGVITIAVFHVASIARINFFLDTIRYRDDWRNLLARFDASGFHSLRTYATYEYMRMTPIVLGLGAFGRAISGALGGAVSGATRTSSSPSR